MLERKSLDPARLDLVIAVLIALVSLTTALAVWRTNIVGSNAAEANRLFWLGLAELLSGRVWVINMTLGIMLIAAAWTGFIMLV